MSIITIWKWKDLDEEVLVQAMGATAILDYPDGYENYVFIDGSGGMSISPDGEPAEAQSLRAHVFAKWCHLTVHHAMSQEDALAIGPKIVELLEQLED